MSKYGVLSGPYFSAFGQYLSVLSPNAGKYEPEKTPHLETFHAVQTKQICLEGESQTLRCGYEVSINGKFRMVSYLA